MTYKPASDLAKRGAKKLGPDGCRERASKAGSASWANMSDEEKAARSGALQIAQEKAREKTAEARAAKAADKARAKAEAKAAKMATREAARAEKAAILDGVRSARKKARAEKLLERARLLTLKANALVSLSPDFEQAKAAESATAEK